jgi:hypothetical protein
MVMVWQRLEKPMAEVGITCLDGNFELGTIGVRESLLSLHEAQGCNPCPAPRPVRPWPTPRHTLPSSFWQASFTLGG